MRAGPRDDRGTMGNTDGVSTETPLPYPWRVLILSAAPSTAMALRRALRDRQIVATLLPLTPARPRRLTDGYDLALIAAVGLTAAAEAASGWLKHSRPDLPVMLVGGDVTPTHERALTAGFDLWLAGATPAAVVAAQAVALCRLLAAVRQPVARAALQVGPFLIDAQRIEVTAAGQVLPLTPTEFRIIASLARAPSQVMLHRALFRDVHGYDATEQEARDILKVHIWRLRNKLVAAGIGGGHIAGVRGFGYLLEPEGTVERRPAAGGR